jgi:hypothetical protein
MSSSSSYQQLAELSLWIRDTNSYVQMVGWTLWQTHQWETLLPLLVVFLSKQEPEMNINPIRMLLITHIYIYRHKCILQSNLEQTKRVVTNQKYNLEMLEYSWVLIRLESRYSLRLIVWRIVWTNEYIIMDNIRILMIFCEIIDQMSKLCFKMLPEEVDKATNTQILA